MQKIEGGREKYIEYIEKLLPPDMKGKAKMVIERMESFLTELMGMFERIVSEPELPDRFKAVTFHKLFSTVGRQIQANEGTLGLCEAGREMIKYIMLSEAQEVAKTREEPRIKVVNSMPQGGPG